MVVYYHGPRKRYWYEHRSDCYCDACFKHKCKQGRKKKKGFTGDYFEYIRSPYWLKRKAKFYKTNKRQCLACGSYSNIDLHHTEYGNFGNEPDYALVTLCRTCHDEFHASNRTQRDMIKTTWAFIRAKQARLYRLRREGML